MRRAAPWLAASAATAAALAAFWPGYTSVDSLHQHAQAMAGAYDNVHPPLFAFAWRQLARLADGSGAMHAALVALFCAGLARTLWAVPMREPARIAAFVAIAAWPPVLLVVAHVWKDVAMAGALLLGAAATLRWRARPHRRDAVAAVAWFALAVAMRHNAWPAVLPFVALLCAPRGGDGRRALPLARGVALALVLLFVPRAIETALDAERKRLTPTVALWDLAALSLATGEVRLPRAVAPQLTLAQVRDHYVPWSCVPLYDSGQVRLALHVPYSDADARAVDAAWLAGVRDAPGAYLAHRARVMAGLLLAPPRDAPRELVYVPEHRVPGDADAAARAPNAAARAVLAFAAATWSTPLFAWLPYGLAALAALPLARRGARAAPLALLASALLYVAPLFVLATSSEYRYVFPAVVACLVSAAASLGSRSAAMREVAHSKARE